MDRSLYKAFPARRRLQFVFLAALSLKKGVAFFDFLPVSFLNLPKRFLLLFEDAFYDSSALFLTPFGMTGPFLKDWIVGRP